MTGIADVAREVNVSTATVSRALRGLPGVTDSTRERVLEAALRLGYAPSPSAVRLASGRTTSVAVVVPYMSRWYFSTVAEGVERGLRERGYDMLLYNLAGSARAREEVFESNLLLKRVDGILIVGLRPTVAELCKLERRPIVFVGTEVPGHSNVRIDDAEAARIAALHLLEQGHRRIAHVGGTDESVLDSTTPLARRISVVNTLRTAELCVEPDHEVDGRFTVAGGLEAGRRLLGLPCPPTAVLASSDEMAIGVIRAALERGLRVPDDLSVIGIDDHDMAELFDLTTVAQPTVQQGRLAAEVLVADLEARAAGEAPEPRQRVLPTRLVLRGSTAALDRTRR